MVSKDEVGALCERDDLGIRDGLGSCNKLPCGHSLKTYFQRILGCCQGHMWKPSPNHYFWWVTSHAEPNLLNVDKKEMTFGLLLP